MLARNQGFLAKTGGKGPPQPPNFNPSSPVPELFEKRARHGGSAVDESTLVKIHCWRISRDLGAGQAPNGHPDVRRRQCCKWHRGGAARPICANSRV